MKTVSKQKTAWLVLLTALICCGIMAVVDGVLRPGYGAKSVCKLLVFLLLPALAVKLDRTVQLWNLFHFPKKGFGIALGLGVSVYCLIVGGYWLLSGVFDFSRIAGALSENAGVDAGNFLMVSLYVSLANSLLEEFFFRGFVFRNLKQSVSRKFAYGFSAVLFALYHAAMLIGWFSPLLYLLVMTGLVAGGLLFNFLNEKLDTIYVSWLVHMFANFAINTIGFMLL